MPRRRIISTRKYGGSLRLAGGGRMRGGRFGDRFVKFLGRANDWLKRTKIGSKLGKWYGSTGLPYASEVGKLADVAESYGYGRRRRMRRIRR